MSFIWPIMLIFLLAIPLWIGLYIRLQRRRAAFAERYGSLGMIRSSAGQRLGIRRHLPPALFLAGLAILLLALARPQAAVGLPRVEGTVILAFDVSGSMAAEDMAPNRMEAAKVVARDFVQRQPPGVRIGVVAFSDAGFAVQPPTSNQPAILAAIERMAPQRGTALGQGIRASLNTLAPRDDSGPRRYTMLTPTPAPVEQASDRSSVIVLLTDGENNGPPDPLEVAQAAAARGIRIYTIGIGSAAGTTLHVNGFTVHTQLDEPALQQIAQLTGGAYFNAANGDDLRAIYENLDLQLVIRPEKTEITSLLAGAGILFLLLGGACSLVWFGRVP